MKVIVAGLPKTGTKSINDALTKLGYNVYDYLENSTFLVDDWTKILTSGWSTEDFKKMYENIDAVVDIPCCYFWEEIHKAFPKSKIILTMRESDEVWAKSLINQTRVNEDHYMIKMLQTFSPTGRKMLNNLSIPLSSIVFGLSDLRDIGDEHTDMLKLKYRVHNAYVLQNAPADKLLVYKVTEGWDPLCKFLQVPVPNEPFPFKNEKGNIIEEQLESHPVVAKMKREMLITFAIITALLSLGIYFVLKKICFS